MSYLLDTDHVSILLRRTGAEYDRLWSRIDRHLPDEFRLSVVSFHEQLLGCHSYIARARRSEVLRGYNLISDLLNYYCPAHVLPFDSSAMDQAESLRGQRVRLATMDLRIAATALSNGLTLLTRNAVDFSKVPGLHFEDWTTP